MNDKVTALIILDGYGFTECQEGNAVKQAHTPFLDSLAAYPHTLITASGLDVGLPEGQMGNSEVGHLNLGAGRVVYQELTRITKSIEDGDFYENETFLEGIRLAKKNNGALHLIGLLSDGGVHSHEAHIHAFLRLAKKEEIERLYIHCFMDGRDTAPDSGLLRMRTLEEKISEIGVGEIVTLMGRYYAMDRDNRWDRIEVAYDAMTMGVGKQGRSPIEVIEENYQAGVTDEFMPPTVMASDENRRIQSGDTVIYFNFRPDRARELTQAFTDPNFVAFERKSGMLDLNFITMTQYNKAFDRVSVAYKPTTIANTLGEYLSEQGIPQLRIAETEKYAHVTYFFNGGVEKQYPLEDRILVPSPKVATYDLLPEMSAYEVTQKVVEAIEREKYRLIVLNFANPDMVGHTGVFEAAKRAVEAVDACAQKVITAILKKGGKVVLTADHGNAEKMIDYETQRPFTAHTNNRVLCTILGAGDVLLRDDGGLSDVAPTLLELMTLAVPKEMTGKSLILPVTSEKK